MKKKIVLIFSIVLLVFSLSFFVGQKVVSSRLNDNSVNDTVKNEEKTTNTEEKNTEDEINNEETEETVKEEEQKTENTEEKEAEKKTDTKTETKADTKTNTNNNTNVKDNSNTTITSSNKNTEKSKVKTETVEESEVTSTKYGVKFLNVKKYQVTTYSDGTVDKKLVSTYKSIDKSGYNATAADLKAEATELVNSNWNKYNEVLSYVNTYRSEKGVSALTLDRELSIAATVRALEMAYTDNMSHTRPNNKDCFTVLDELGISRGHAWGENVAAGYSSPKSVAEGWKNSPGHYANMIDSRFSKIGIGMAQLSGTTYGTYWAQLFVG